MARRQRRTVRNVMSRRAAASGGRSGISALLARLLGRLQGWVWRNLRRLGAMVRRGHEDTPASRRAPFVMEALEPRVLMSGDLAIGSLAYAAPGSATVQLVKQGDMPADPVRLKVYASPDGTLDGTDRLLGQLDLPAARLAGETIAPIQVPLDESAIGQPGTYRLIGVVDADDAFAETDEDNNRAVAGNTLTLVGTIGATPAGIVPAVTLTDADGTRFTVSISGPGSVAVGVAANGYTLAVTGSDATTQVLLQASGGDGRVLLGGVAVAGSLKSFDAASADLRGTLNVTGALRTLVLRDATGAAIGTGGTGLLDITGRDFSGVRLQTSQIANTVRINAWTTAGGTASLQAGGLNSLTATGAFTADLVLSGAGAGPLVLGTFKAGGSIGAALWSIGGRAGTIAFGSSEAGWHANIEGALSQLVTTGNLSGTLAAGSLQLLQAGGSLVDATLLVGADLGSDAARGGTGDAADQFAAGTLARVRVAGAVTRSVLWVGIDPVNGIAGDGDDTQLGGAANRLQELSIGGALDAASRIVAPAFPASVRINGASVAPGTLPQLGNVPGDGIAPVLTARLITDSGASGSDGITNQVAVTGTALDLKGATVLLAGLDPAGGGLPTVDLSASLAAGGLFILSAEQILALAGGMLAQGPHTLRLQARDAAGNASAVLDIAFTYDSVAPAVASFDLAPASDSGTPGDQTTDAATVTLAGSAPGAASVKLSGTDTAVPVGTDGSFAFTGIGLALGVNSFTVVATDAAGNAAERKLDITRIPGTGNALELAAELANDTGSSATDGITSAASITGKTTGNAGVVKLVAVLDPAGDAAPATDISFTLQPDGSFAISVAQLAQLGGGTLADGAHVLRLQATGNGGVVSNIVDVAFTLDTTAPAAFSAAIAASDQAGDALTTASARVQIKGLAEAGATVRLATQDISALAGADGTFVLAGVALAPGANTLALTAVDAAGNARSASVVVTRVEQQEKDAVLTWNTVALKAIQLDVTDPPVATRILAMESLAVYDTLAAIEGTPAFMVQRSVAGPVSVDAAVAVAAHRILALSYPAQRAQFDTVLGAGLAAIPDGEAKDTGIALGLTIADAVWAARSGDGFDEFVEIPGSSVPGKWRPTAPVYDVADNPQWATVQPFALNSPDEYRPDPPPALDTAAYADAVAEIRSLGAANSTTRTADQTQQALFWADGGGSYTPPGHWNQIANEISLSQANSLSTNARLFAQLNVALADAAIACWDAKYEYRSWRPETAIQLAGEDGNDATVADPAWRPLLLTPPHPDYVSGHSAFSAAAATILEATFGNDTAFSTTSATLPNVTRSFTSFRQAAEEAGRSRIYAGIHFEFANAAAAQLGDQVGAAVLARFALTEDTQAPVVVLDDTPAATNANVTLQGQLLDNLSGVAGAQYRIDDGALQDLVLQDDGRFAIATAFAIDGSSDGQHTITVVARDAAGNLGSAVTRSFVLDTGAPVLTLGSLPDQASLAGGVRLTGAADAGQAGLTRLDYRIDDGPVRSIAFDAAGGFDTPLLYGDLDVGTHVLTLSAQDAAGNVATLVRTVKVDTLAAFGVMALVPTDGAGTIGVTQRPLLTFTRAVNTATLTADSFYATGPDGSKLEASIVPSDDGTYAWLFFKNPMPGGARITLHVDGSKIRAAADGAFLDADGNGVAGGTMTRSFTTVSTTSLAGTKLVGRVVDPGADLLPMTFDDIRRGPDGVIYTPDDVFLNPIAHAKVYILGQEDRVVYTDANGWFELDGVPSGNVKVAIDGRTATNAPNGVFFPEMVMDATLRAGSTNTLMGTMGTPEEQAAHLTRGEVYLPRIATSVLQPLNATGETVVTVTDATGAPDLSAEERAHLTLTVQPGSALGEDGQQLGDAMIGISTVPPELVRDMLPPGVLQHTFDITIQAPGVAAFAEPVQITFPNVFKAPPGTKLNILSFDHTTGRLVINGTGTVSADGSSVTSDEGAGVRMPGWHGMTPPGSVFDMDPPKEPPPPHTWEEITATLEADYASVKGTASAVLAHQVACLAMHACENADTWGNGWVKNVFDLETDKAQDRLDGKLPENILSPALDRALDYIPGDIRIPIIVGGVVVHNVTASELGALYQGFLRHFPSELLPAFIANACNLQDTYIDPATGEERLLHDGLFDDAVVPCFEELRDAGEISTFAMGVAQTIVPIAAKVLREVVYAVYCDEPGAKAAALEAVAGLGYTREDLWQQSLADAGTLRVNAGDDFFLDVGGSYQLQVLRTQADGSVIDIAKLPDTEIYVTSDQGTVRVDAGGLLKILGTTAPLAVMQSGFLVIVRNGDDVGIGQFAIQDKDSDGNLLGDAFETLLADGGASIGTAEDLRAAILGSSHPAVGRPVDFVLENLSDGTVQRGKTGADGSIKDMFVAADSAFRLTLFDRVTGLTAASEFSTDASGQRELIAALPLAQSMTGDTDQDGLSDEAELVLGTRANAGDSDNDGIGDYTEVENGGDPLSGLQTATGQLGATSTTGAAAAVAVASAGTNLERLYAYVATSTHGLAVVDVTAPSAPVKVSELALAGFSGDIAVDARRGIAALAGQDGGLHLVDISSAAAPRLLQTVAMDGDVNGVRILDGIAFVAYDRGLATIDINTGLVLQQYPGNGGVVTSLAIDGDSLYAIDSERKLSAYAINGSELMLADSLGLAQGGGRLFVGGGVAYVGYDDGFNSGFSTVDVSDPDNLSLISGVDATNLAGTAIVANGSGLALAVGSPGGVFGANVLDLIDVRDPSDTAKFVTRFTLPVKPLDVALANGLAFIADGSAGLIVVNYLANDTKQVAPVASIAVDGIDADPSTPGVQVLEGRTVRITPTVSDDVQVRNVEVLINGNPVSRDVAFPFEFLAQAPAIAAGGTTMTVQVRATDTGGNVALSELVTLTVVPDTFAPVLQSASIADGDRRFFVRSVGLAFDEPLDTTRLAASGVSVLRAGADGAFGTADDTAIPVRFDTRAFGQSVSIIVDTYLPPGEYRLRVDPSIIADRAGNVLADAIVRTFTVRPASDIRAATGVPEIPTAPSANPGQQIGVAVPFDPASARLDIQTGNANGTLDTVTVNAVRWDAASGTAWFNLPFNAVSGDAVVYGVAGGVRTDFPDGTFPLQIVPVITGVEIQSVSSDGSSAVVVLRGTGLVEGNGSEYRFGSGTSAVTVVDAGANSGPDVQQVYDPAIGQYVNGQVTLTVPLSNGAFGPVSIRTAGGTSASLTSSLAGVNAVALSGTPADAAKASANAGQAIALTGTGLSTDSDILVRYRNVSGVFVTERLSPAAASADGTTATLVLPRDVNGILTLQMFGSAQQPVVQIVPTVERINGSGYLVGSGLVEGGTRYDLPGIGVDDTEADAGVDIATFYDPVYGYSANNQAYFGTTLPHFGFGTATVTTEGGTSAPRTVDVLRPGSDTAAAGGVGDIAVDPVTGMLWTIDDNNPAHLLRIDPADGKVLQTITLTAEFGNQYTANRAGLQIAPQALSLAGVTVPAGTLLLVEGYQYNTNNGVVAVDPANGAVLARLELPVNYAMTAGLLDPATGHLFVLSEQFNAMIELDARTGAELARVALPVNVQSYAGLALDPVDGNLWIAGRYSSRELVKVDRAGVELARADLSALAPVLENRSITGLAFAQDGSVRIASNDGTVYRAALRLQAQAVPTPTLTAIAGSALQGTAAQAGQAAANVGQVIELTGSNFGPGTQVLFEVRDAAGVTSVLAVTPQLVDAGGTRLQVIVPDLASTGNVRVANVGTVDHGFGGAMDGVHRNLGFTFTAGGSTSTIRFADGGLQGLDSESWGLDNVQVRQGGTVVFSDDFEAGAKAAWSNPAVSSDSGILTAFSGRFNNANQALNLTGLTAGQVYTVNFDLYALGGWDGLSGAPDQVAVTVDDQEVWKRTISNTLAAAQDINATPGLRLQIVPTLEAISGEPGSDGAFTLQGSGFMEGATTVAVGGIAAADQYNDGATFDVYGARNGQLRAVVPLALDGPVRVITEGGWAELPRAASPAQAAVAFTGIAAAAQAGVPADPARPAANTGQLIVLTGQGFTSSTQVRFQAVDDSGVAGTVTVTGSVADGGTTLTVRVPVLAKSGAVAVGGSIATFDLQVVPVLRAIGGSVAPGQTLLLEGTGLVASELVIQVDGRGVGSFQVDTVSESTSNGVRDQQLLRITVPAGAGAGVITVSTAGGTATLRAGAVSLAALPDLVVQDAGDTLAAAIPVAIAAGQRVGIDGVLENNRDVDLYRVDLAAGETLAMLLSNHPNSHLRVFAADGTELADTYYGVGDSAPFSFTAIAGGSYWVGISAYYNTAYDPLVANSGTDGSFFGPYLLALERIPAGAGHLSGSAAVAASGTPAQAAIASANAEQSIVLTGRGLLAGDRVVFSVLNDSGQLSENIVAPTSVAADGNSLTVLVPLNATTGSVRLERDRTGVLLQVVPTLTGIDAGNGGQYGGGALTLTGSGFAEGNTAVSFGTVRLDDLGRNYGLDIHNGNRSLNLTVPESAPSGPIRVSTIGGTSAAFNVSLTGIAGTAATGAAADPAQASAVPGQLVTLTGIGLTANSDFVFQTVDANGRRAEVVVRPTILDGNGTQAQVRVPRDAVTGGVRMVGDITGTTLPLQIVPVVSGVEIQSVSSDGSSAVVVLRGTGLVEGNGSEYRFGSGASAVFVLDATASTGPDVQQVYDPAIGQYVNGQVTLTVPLSNGAFGPVSIRTAGGTSASLTSSLAGVNAVALSGTPADAAKASANAGQAIALTGTGLSTDSDILVRYRNVSGVFVTERLSPAAASADGTTATLVLPRDVNGILTLQMFGSAQQPVVQIVPTVERINGSGYLVGSGLVEGGTRYDLPGIGVDDTEADAGVDIATFYDPVYGYSANNQAYFGTTLPHFGFGTATVTTEGGTSAPRTVDVLRPGSDTAAAGGVGDIAVDPVTGMLWTIDDNNPAHLLRIDPADGKVLQTITLTAEFGNQYTANRAGLQIAPQALSLAGVTVPAGTLLLVEGYQYNTNNGVVAVDPANGAVLARLELPVNYAMTAGLLDPATGHLFVLSEQFNAMIELDARTGAELARVALPVNVQSYAGLALDPVDGNLWIAGRYSSRELVKVDRAGVELARADLSALAPVLENRSITGLAFAQDGSVRIASNDGTVYRAALRLQAQAVPTPTLTAIAGSALQGTAAQAGQAAANVGQVIELTGSNFGPGTQVLFEVRDAAGVTSVLAVTPQLVDAGGTRLQVIVPDLASTGNVRVANVGTVDHGFGGAMDGVHRNLGFTFTAGGSTSTIRFADGGLQGLDSESWGLDNVQVRQGGTVVFSDDFEAGAKAAWSNPAVSSDSGILTAFSGRFNNANQALNLTGLTAGQVYTVNFDLYALGGWDGLSGAPDQVAVTVDDQEVWKRTISNTLAAAQDINATPGLRLQIVPTLEAISGEPGSDGAFTLQGSGFMEGATTVAVGGIAAADQYNDGATFDVYGARNGQLRAVVPLALDGPVRVTTEGGWAELPASPFVNAAPAAFTAILPGTLPAGTADPDLPAAVPGQSIVLSGQGFTGATRVQFQGVDDQGTTGTITVTGTASQDGRTLTVLVPVLARSGAVFVAGAAGSIDLQVVPLVRGIAGTFGAGNAILLDGAGFDLATLQVTIDGRAATVAGLRTIADTGLPQQLLRVTVPEGVTAGVLTVATAGGTAVVRTGTTVAAQAGITPAEAGDTLAGAVAVALGADHGIALAASLADGSDVDLYRLDLKAGERLSLALSAHNHAYLRVFDANGTELASGQRAAGDTTPVDVEIGRDAVYYIGVSGYNNAQYDPLVSGSGTSSYAGTYTLNLARQQAGTSRLAGSDAVAASGTPALAGLPSANTGQTITLTGVGLGGQDQVVFITQDNNGTLRELPVAPAAVAADGLSLSVKVPDTAVTGTVRLARDDAGIVLLIVPTLSAATTNGGAYTGALLHLTGSGFTEGTVGVSLGGSVVRDLGRNYGIDVYGNGHDLAFAVPEGAAGGPITVSTAGGTSAALGTTFTGIGATAASGSPADATLPSAAQGQVIQVNGTGLATTAEVVFQVIDHAGRRADVVVRPSAVNAAGTVADVRVPVNAVTGTLRLLGDAASAGFMLQVVPVLTGLAVQSVAADGSSATVLLTGSGLVEGNGSSYVFGSGTTAVTVLDPSTSLGPDVHQVYDPAQNAYVNGAVLVTVPLAGGAFGPVTVRTEGGTSAVLTTGLAGIVAQAATGTPADPAIASANPGQSITLTGTGLSTASSILLRYVSETGAPAMLRLHPTAASEDGTQATLVVPLEANGVTSLQMFGSAAQPVLQIVPTLLRFDQDGTLRGSGLVEGGTRYAFPGAAPIVDAGVADGVDISYYYDPALGNYRWNGQASIPAALLPSHGAGVLTVTTAGGSATLAVDSIRPGTAEAAIGGMGDVAVDRGTGALWALDQDNPAHVLRIDPATGRVAQSIALTAAMGGTYTGNYAGLQVLPQGATLAGTAVPSGSLLLTIGYPSGSNGSVVALDPASGAVLARLALPETYYATGALFDAASGHLFLLSHQHNRLVEIDPANGAELASFAVPVNVQTAGGIALDPVDGNLWIAGYNSGEAIKINRAGEELRRVRLYAQDATAFQAAGLAFDAGGFLLVATTGGAIERVSIA